MNEKIFHSIYGAFEAFHNMGVRTALANPVYRNNRQEVIDAIDGRRPATEGEDNGSGTKSN